MASLYSTVHQALGGTGNKNWMLRSVSSCRLETQALQKGLPAENGKQSLRAFRLAFTNANKKLAGKEKKKIYFPVVQWNDWPPTRLLIFQLLKELY